MKRTIYISGKITGTTDFVERFARAESRLKLQGWRVINPVKKCRHINPNTTEWHHYMRRDIRLLTRCDALYSFVAGGRVVALSLNSALRLTWAWTLSRRLEADG